MSVLTILWRQLFDNIGVRWTDRGANTARNHVNIRCPMCGTADPSAHLGIEETTGAYYCLRNPTHGGRSAPYLLMRLGVPSFQIDGLLREFGDDSPPTRVQRYREPTAWDKFPSAIDNSTALTYLRSRGFDPPAEAVRRYDMRFTIAGRHSWRILLPLRLNHDIIGWTGRATGKHQEPRYLTNDPSDGASLYIPVYPTNETRIIVLVEGPFDAIAICDAYQPTRRVIGIAVTGLHLSPLRRQHLADVIAMAHPDCRVLLTLDTDQERNIRENFLNLVARGTGIPYPEIFPLALEHHDTGGMTREQIRRWLAQLPQRGGHDGWQR